MGTDRLLTTRQAAERLGISMRRVRELVSDGELGPPIRFGRNGKLRFTDADLDRLIERSREPAAVS